MLDGEALGTVTAGDKAGLCPHFERGSTTVAIDGDNFHLQKAYKTVSHRPLQTESVSGIPYCLARMGLRLCIG
jgi:hypothetical protein